MSAREFKIDFRNGVTITTTERDLQALEAFHRSTIRRIHETAKVLASKPQLRTMSCNMT